jgi:DNA-binding response OmpR family regulator
MARHAFQEFLVSDRKLQEAGGAQPASANGLENGGQVTMSRLDSRFSFARFVKEDPRFQGTPVIILTSVTSRTGLDFHPKTPEDLAAMHVDAYFDKPVSPLALVEKVRELLHRKCPTANGE